MQYNRIELYNQWVDKVCHYIEKVGPCINCASCAFQSAPLLDKSPDVVFLGYNAHEPWGYTGVNRERFYKGNPFFYADRDKSAWKVWWKLYEAFKWANYLTPMTDGNFIFMNAIYFGSNTIKEFQSRPNSAEIAMKCIDFTGEVIQDIFRPKCVICFSINDCFRQLEQRFNFTQVETVRPPIINGEPAHHQVIKGLWNCTKVFGIPHPSGRISNDDWGAIAMYLKKEITAL